jgi:hypothetical protein
VNLSHRLSALDRLQKTRAFKLVATGLVLALFIGLGVAYAVAKQARVGSGPALMLEPPPPELAEPQDPSTLTEAERQANEMALAARRATEANVRAFNDILARRADTAAVWVGLSVGAAVCLAAVWLGLGLTGLGLLVLIGLISGPMFLAGRLIPPEVSAWGGRLRETGKFVAGVGVLGFAFLALMQGLRALLGGPWAITAIARNVVNEAVRMRVSVVFIVMLLFMLAALPGLLDEDTPLRYRVQSFLQYGSGGSFWIIAILTLFLAVGTVAFEQRDKIIWQTMTKPVAGWQYLLGKWLGVVGVSAVLLAISSSGVFLFVEYLRNQKALGEVEPYIAASGPITEDRFVLENQVLRARAARTPLMPQMTAESAAAELQERIDRVRQADPNWVQTEENVQQLYVAMEQERRTAFLAIEPGAQERYTFTGLSGAKAEGTPLTLRYRIDFGSNDPRETYRVSFLIPNQTPAVQEVPGGQTMTINISPVAIDDQGNLSIVAVNGDVLRYFENPQDPGWTNDITMSFPPDGLEAYYAVGSYRLNFLRVMIVLWLKLAFLAMVAVWAATFLSFPVASLVAFGVFLIAESAGFLTRSLEYFASVDAQGNVDYWRLLVRGIAAPVAGTFRFYAELRPTANLVDGRLVSWSTVVLAAGVLGGLAALLYALAVGIFRNRELATYSGQ